MSLFFKVAKNTFYQIIGKVGGTIVALFSVGLMTRYLGQTGFGYYTTIVAFLNFFGVLVDFGLQMAAGQMISKPNADEKNILSNIFTIRLISSFIFFGLATILIWLFPYPLIIKQGAAIASLSFFFIALQSVIIALYQKKLDMSRVAIAEFISRIIMLIGVWLAITSNTNLLYIISAIVVANLFGFIILYIGSFKYFKIKLKFQLFVWKSVWHTAWPLAITIVLTMVYFRADTIILSLYRPQSDVGIYGATYKVLEVLIQFPYLFLGLLLPILTNFYFANKKIFQFSIQKALDFLLIISVPMVISSIILGEKIMVFVAGPEFLLSGQLLKILIFAVAAIFIGALFGYAIVSAELQKKMIKYYIIDAVISLPLYFWLIPIYGYWAAAYLTVLTELIITVSAYYVLTRHALINLTFKLFWKSFVASLLMAGFLLLAINTHIIFLSIFGFLIYVTALLMLRGINKNDIRQITQFKQLQ